MKSWQKGELIKNLTKYSKHWQIKQTENNDYTITIIINLELYNYRITSEYNLLKFDNVNEKPLTILEWEVLNAILTFKKGKSLGPDKISR